MEKQELEVLLQQAKKGRELWLQLERKCNITYDVIVYIMPHPNDEINEYAMKHRNEVLEMKHAQKLVIIVIGENQKKLIEQQYGVDCEIVVISQEDMMALMKYNDMTTFSSQTIILSFMYGSDHDARSLGDGWNLNLEELVCVGLLGLQYVSENLLNN